MSEDLKKPEPKGGAVMSNVGVTNADHVVNTTLNHVDSQLGDLISGDIDDSYIITDETEALILYLRKGIEFVQHELRGC